MGKIKRITKVIFTESLFKRLFSYGILILILYFIRDFFGLFFITFILSYIFFSMGIFIKEKIYFFLNKIFFKSKRSIITTFIPLNLIIFFEYIIFIGFIILVLSKVLPSLIGELKSLPNTIPFLQDKVGLITEELETIINDYTLLGNTITEIVNSKDFSVIKNIFTTLKDAGIKFLQFILALILSFIFIIDRVKLKFYFQKIKKSNFEFMYNDYEIIFHKIVKSFGLILEAQGLIAIINTTLTVIGLYTIGIVFYLLGLSSLLFFPYILTIGVIVFILGFIPILGTILSSIPILIIGYSFIGGIPIIIAIIGLISLIHMVEAYYLNPKIVSSYIKLPMSLTFIILIISEHIFGLGGLLIGISLFYFIALILKDLDRALYKIKNKLYKK